MNAAVEVDRLLVRRGGRTVLEGLTCAMDAGRITGLLGPSGAGKTTLIRAIVGVQKVAGGTVTVLGSPAGSAGLRARIGYVTQSPSVYVDLSVRENVHYFGAVTGAPAGAVDAVIEEVGLTSHRDRVITTLSGGQRNRASLACALVGDPDVLILDEPTVGLDPVLREELWESFRRRADAGATVLVSSHVMDEAHRCDRLLLLRDGVLIADDTPQAVMADAGAANLDSAFLTLIRRGGEAA